MIKKACYMGLLLLSQTVYGDSMQHTQREGEELGRTGFIHSAQAEEFVNQLREKNPFDVPDEKSLSENGVNAFQQDEIGQFVNKQRFKNPAWVFGDKDPLLESEKAYASCATSYIEAKCYESPQVFEGCVENLTIDVEYPPKETFTLEVFASSYAEKRTTFYVDLKNGVLIAQYDASSARAGNTPLLEKYQCQDLSFSYQGAAFYHDSSIGGEFQTHDVVYDAPAMPSCGNNLTTSFSISQTHHKKNKWKNRGIKHIFLVTYQPHMVFHDRWVKNCLNPASLSPKCTLLNDSICLSGPGVKNIGGINISRECWQKKASYHCEKKTSQCAALREKGCELVKRQCHSNGGKSGCDHQELTFRCPTSSCKAKKPQIDGYCMKGDCYQPQAESLGSFEEAIAHLGGAFAAGKDMNTSEIFKGQALSCRTMGVNFSNCCQDKGWGYDLHLTDCKAEEKLLGMAKEAKRAIEVGEYCDHKMASQCIEKKKSYCVFPSKLARIIQAGAIRQLGRSFGDPGNPQCVALTPQDLQAMDWNKIDFSELYEDIRAKTVIPKEGDLANKINQHLSSH